MNSSNTAHKLHIPKNTLIKAVSIHISKEHLEAFLNDIDTELSVLFEKNSSVFLYKPLNTMIKERFQAIMNNPLDSFMQSITLHKDLAILIELAFTSILQNTFNSLNRSLNTTDVEALINAEKQLVANVKEAPSINSLAQSAAMSPTKFKKAFKKLYGKSVYDYYLSYRMELALCLVKENRKSVSEIARSLGYTNISHFSRLFKKYFGEYPSKYE